MKTAFMLLARYDGLPVIPVETVCKDFFSHLTVEKFLRMVAKGQIALQVENGGVTVEDLAKYVNDRVDIARLELRARTEAQAKLDFVLDAALAEPLPKVTIYFIEAGDYV